MAAGPWLVVRPALLSFVCFAAFVLHPRRPATHGRGLWRLMPLQLLWSQPARLRRLSARSCALRAIRPPLSGQSVFPPRRIAAAHRRHRRSPSPSSPASSPLGWRLYIDPFVVVYHQPLITEWTRTSLGFLLRYDLPLLVLGLSRSSPRSVRARPDAIRRRSSRWSRRRSSLMAVRMIALGAILAAPLAARRLAPRSTRARARVRSSSRSSVSSRAGDRVDARLRASAAASIDVNLPEGAVQLHRRASPRRRAVELLALRRLARLAPRIPTCASSSTAAPDASTPSPSSSATSPPSTTRAFSPRSSHEYDLQWAVVRARPGESFGEPIARDPKWTMVYLDDCAAVYVRNDGPNRALAQRRLPSRYVI